MISRRAAVPVFALMVVLGAARDAGAGLVDWIMQLSGPTMQGFVIDCRISLPNPETPECYFFKKLSGSPIDSIWWLSLEGGFYYSTNNDNNNPYDWFDVRMVAVDPIFQVEWFSRNERRFRMYSGAGGTLNFLSGKRFDAFGKLGAKVRPVTIEYRWPRVTLSGAYNFRFYANKFTSADFGFEPDGSNADDPETVRSISIGLRLDF